MPRTRKPYLSPKVVAAIPRVLNRFTAADLAADPQLASVINYLAEWEQYVQRPEVVSKRKRLAESTAKSKAKLIIAPAPKRGDVFEWEGVRYTRLSDLARAMFPAEPLPRTLTRIREGVQRGLTLKQIAANFKKD